MPTSLVNLLRVLLLGVVALAVGACGSETAEEPSEPTAYRYVIPAGTGAAIEAGEPVEIIPSRMEIKVGDTIEITNFDDRGHTVGPFYVGAAETVSQTFQSPAIYVAKCTIKPTGEITIVVT